MVYCDGPIPNHLRDRLIRGAAPNDIPEGVPIYMGLDLASGPDQTAVVVTWGDPTGNSFPLAKDTPVQKTKGYPFPGVVLGQFQTLTGQTRYVVERVGENETPEGLLHIFNRVQLEVRFPVLSDGRVAEMEADFDRAFQWVSSDPAAVDALQPVASPHWSDLDKVG